MGRLFEAFDDIEPTGRDSLGKLYAARSRKDGRFVRLRHTTRQGLEDPAVAGRVRNEAMILSRITHRCIPRFIDFIEDEAEGTLLVTAHENTRPLVEDIERRLFGRRAAVTFALTLADALGRLHDAGFVHRFLLPGNVHVTGKGLPWLADISLAAGGDRPSKLLVIPDDFGLELTVPFLPPEVLKKESSDRRSDIFQLGMVLYYCLAGRPPMWSEEYVSLVASAGGELPPPSVYRDSIGSELDEAVMRMLRLARNDRPADVSTARTILKPFRAGRSSDRVHRPGGRLHAGTGLPVPGEWNRHLPLVAVLSFAVLVSAALFTIPGKAPVSPSGSRDSTSSGRTPNDTATGTGSTHSPSGSGDPTEGAGGTGGTSLTLTTGSADAGGQPPSQVTSSAAGGASAAQIQPGKALSPAATSSSGRTEQVTSQTVLPPEALELPASALYAVGVCYHQGLGRPADPAKAVMYYRLAAERGDARACNNIGYCLATGSGTKKSPGEALEWFKRAAAKGCAEGACNVGLSYIEGFGTDRNPKLALQWLMVTAERGDPRAQYRLAVAYELDDSIPRHLELAVQWYRKAARANYPPALSALGYCYDTGLGVEKDTTQAALCCRRAARLCSAAQMKKMRGFLLSLNASGAADSVGASVPSVSPRTSGDAH